MKVAEQERQTIDYIDGHLMEARNNLHQLADVDLADMFFNATFSCYLRGIL